MSTIIDYDRMEIHSKLVSSRTLTVLIFAYNMSSASYCVRRIETIWLIPYLWTKAKVVYQWRRLHSECVFVCQYRPGDYIVLKLPVYLRTYRTTLLRNQREQVLQEYCCQDKTIWRDSILRTHSSAVHHHDSTGSSSRLMVTLPPTIPQAPPYHVNTLCANNCYWYCSG